MASDISERLRDQVARRAAYRCEYCRIGEDDAGFPHHVDHVISRKHGGPSVPENLAYACATCNRHKGADVASVHPDTGDPIRLFNPRRDRWADHFQLDGPHILPLTEIGAVTLRLLRLNDAERVVERRILQSLARYPRSREDRQK